MSDGPSFLLVTSNGVGMGHLARQLAVARAAGDRARSTLFSMSRALPTVLIDGARGEYCPGPDRDWVPISLWAQYVAARIQALAGEVGANVVVFDGVAPYRGVTLARQRMPETPFVWFRRGMWKPGVNTGQLWKSRLFDEIIEPGDIAQDADSGPTAGREETNRVSPVSLVEVIEPLARAEAAERLGLDPQRGTILMTLGTGRLGEVAAPGAVIVEKLLTHTDWQIGVVKSSIASNAIPLPDDERVVAVTGVFPLARYLAAFDTAVSAAGYNSIHELIPAGLPTLVVPNIHTRTDDQAARARQAASLGVALTAHPGSTDELRRGVSSLADPVTQDSIRQAIAELPREAKLGGAGQTVDRLFDLVAGFEPAPQSMSTRMLRLRDDGKESLKRLLGPEGTNRVRRLLGRQPIDTSEMLRVVAGSGNGVPPGVRRLRFLENPSTAELAGSDPVEHVLEGSSAGYRANRELIAGRFYDVVNRR